MITLNIIRVKKWLGLLVVATGIIAGCSLLKGNQGMKIEISSPDFNEGEMIPKDYTCDGDNLPPTLVWSKAPEGSKELILIMDDPDAPSGTFVHWVVYGIDPKVTGLQGGVTVFAGIPGIIQGMNSARHNRYDGPCPPKGPAHRYFFKIYALNTRLDLEPGATKVEVEKKMKDHIIGSGQLVEKYGR